MREINFRLVQISDSHISKFGGFYPDSFEKAVSEINSLKPKPNLIVHCGDLTDYGILLDYEYALEKLEELKPDIEIASGNHDQRNYGNSLFREMVGPLDRIVSLDQATLFILNSPTPDRDEGRLGRRRQQFLEHGLSKVPDDKLKIVVFHHHLVPVPFSGREANVLEDAGDVLHLVLRNRVDFVLMGHRHVGRALKINDTILVNVGTLSSIRTRGRFGHSFNIIDVYSDGSVRITEKNLTLNREFLVLETKRQTG
ncbi:metallophosphoesterase [Candidatus Bathyarchaeota archaeon]|nr:metallophosphoesterase [Candidatus Bathyarchaeota archaeon]RLI23829.1 MAG: hypothetical protein DRO58_08295 [Candidatus Bathyarchaeota archaeon]